MNAEFGEILIEHLNQSDRSASWLAQRLQKHPSTISKWLTGESRPATPELVARIADVLGIHEGKRRGELLLSAGYAYHQGESVPVSATEPPHENESLQLVEVEQETAQAHCDNENQEALRATLSKGRRLLGIGLGIIGVELLIGAIYVSATALRLIMIALGVLLLVLALVIALTRRIKVELNISFSISGSGSTQLILMVILLLELVSWMHHKVLHSTVVQTYEGRIASDTVGTLPQKGYSDALSGLLASDQFASDLYSSGLPFAVIKRTVADGYHHGCDSLARGQRIETKCARVGAFFIFRRNVAQPADRNVA